MGIFSISKIESLFPSLSIYFFPHFCPSPNPNFGVSWGKIGLEPPPHIASSAVTAVDYTACTPYNVLHTLSTHCTVYIVHCTHCILYDVDCIKYSPQLHCTWNNCITINMWAVFCLSWDCIYFIAIYEYCIHCTLYNIHQNLYTVKCTIYTSSHCHMKHLEVILACHMAVMLTAYWFVVA